jgi:hypothetical protein
LRGKQTQILGGQQRGNGSAKMISMAMQFIIINLEKNIESIFEKYILIFHYSDNSQKVRNILLVPKTKFHV